MNPSWSTDGISYSQFPGAYLFGGRPRSRKQDNIKHETDTGAKFVYNLFNRDVIEITFRVSDTDLDDFAAFDTDVQGEVIPFYFSLRGDGSDAIYVRKEAGFDPRELDGPGGNEAIYDYTLKMETEIP